MEKALRDALGLGVTGEIVRREAPALTGQREVAVEIDPVDLVAEFDARQRDAVGIEQIEDRLELRPGKLDIGGRQGLRAADVPLGISRPQRSAGCEGEVRHQTSPMPADCRVLASARFLSSGRSDVRTKRTPARSSCSTMVCCWSALKFWKLLTLTPTGQSVACVAVGSAKHRAMAIAMDARRAMRGGRALTSGSRPKSRRGQPASDGRAHDGWVGLMGKEACGQTAFCPRRLTRRAHGTLIISHGNGTFGSRFCDEPRQGRERTTTPFETRVRLCSDRWRSLYMRHDGEPGFSFFELPQR